MLSVGFLNWPIKKKRCFMSCTNLSLMGFITSESIIIGLNWNVSLKHLEMIFAVICYKHFNVH